MRLLYLLVLFVLVSSNEERTFITKLKSGFEFAGKLLGIDQANGVAKLVSEAFGKTQPKGEAEGGNIFSGFLRVLGLNTKRIGAIAVNAIIFVAQLISTSLVKQEQIEHKRSYTGTPFDWMLNFTTIRNMMKDVKDKELPNRIIVSIKEHSLDEETDCVQLLVCKGAPFVWGMQRALQNDKAPSGGTTALYYYLPNVEEVLDNGEVCERKHPYCLIGV